MGVADDPIVGDVHSQQSHRTAMTGLSESKSITFRGGSSGVCGSFGAGCGHDGASGRVGASGV